MPNRYVNKSDRERQARVNKSLQTLLAICDDPRATPETKLQAVKLLGVMDEQKRLLEAKDEQISNQAAEISEFKGQLEIKSGEFDEACKHLEAALKARTTCEKRIEELEATNKRLDDEGTDFNEKLTKTEHDKRIATEQAEHAEAVAEELIGSLQILVEEFVPPQERHATALRQFDAHGTKLSPHWYRALDFENPGGYKAEIKQFTELIAKARKQEREWRPGVVYTRSDFEVMGDLFLYQLLVSRDKWLQNSLIDFFQSQGADYSKWLRWDSGERLATDDERARDRFSEARDAYKSAVKLGGRYLVLPVSTPHEANNSAR